MNQIALDFSQEQGRKAMLRGQVRAEHAMPGFTVRAADFMLACLVLDGPMSGEDLTDRAKAAGFVVPDDRAFGSAFRRLLQIGARIVGTCPRVKGHGSSGGKVYAA